jgi:TonB family protein
MTKTATKSAPRTKAAGSFFDLAVRQPSRRFSAAITGSLLFHVLAFSAWWSTSLINPPEILEIREISFVDENEQPPVKDDEPFVPIGNGKSKTLDVPGASGDDETAPVKNEEMFSGNTYAETQSGAVNAERSEREVNVNKIGVLGLLDGVAENGEAGNDLALNMQAADGAVQNLKMNRSLTVGKGNNPRGEEVDGALAAMSRDGKGIDDLLAIDANEGVALKKGTRVQFAGFGGTGGNGGAYGARSEASLYAVLNMNIGRLQYIYEKYLRQNPRIGGKVEVEIIIRSDGSVAKVSFLSSEIPLQAFLDELGAAIKRWRYDPIDEGKVRVVYPLVFIKVG